LYEDAGDTRGYQTGEGAWTKITAMQSGNETTIEISPTKGHYAGMPASRSYEIRLPGDWPLETADISRASDAVIEKRDRKWRFEGNTLTTAIYVAETKVSGKVTVRVFRSADLMARRGELDGFAGAMIRLHSAVETIQHAWPFSMVPEELIDAAQTGDRLGYYPAKAGEIVAHYHEVLPKAQAKVAALAKAGISDEQKQVLAKTLGDTWNTPEARAAVADYPNKMTRALAAVNDVTGKGSN